MSMVINLVEDLTTHLYEGGPTYNKVSPTPSTTYILTDSEDYILVDSENYQLTVQS